MESTRTAACTEGWERDSYNFYGLYEKGVKIVYNKPKPVEKTPVKVTVVKPKPTSDNVLRNPCNSARIWHNMACSKNEAQAMSYLKKMSRAKRSAARVDIARRSKACRKQVMTINASCMSGFINDMKKKGCVLD